MLSNGHPKGWTPCSFRDVPRRLCQLLIFASICFIQLTAPAQETWQSALSRMPLGTNVTELNRSNCIKIMLPAFQSNAVVKALIFMPGATDEFYMFRRARATLTNDNPTLLDAVNALTNQTLIHATFKPPMLLLHSDEDPLEPIVVIKSQSTADRLARTPFLPHAVFNDYDYDSLLPILRKTLGNRYWPFMHSRESFHFYRHSFAAWNLNGAEALRAVAYAGKTKYIIHWHEIEFQGDTRIMALPKIDHFPQ